MQKLLWIAECTVMGAAAGFLSGATLGVIWAFQAMRDLIGKRGRDARP